MKLRRDRNSVSSLQAQLVFVTKSRRKILTQESLNLIAEVFKSVARKMDFEVLEFNGEADYVRLLIAYPPKWSISQMVNALKGVSSRKCGQAKLPKPYGKNALWSPSYLASSVGGAPLHLLVAYIQNQEKLP
ncbi:IS200/IS605 family transposase [Synechococcus sp. W60.2]|jgi:putative transposase|uniref:IS200/IS605 family transposase n=1 Tax=unclassified Synechococcus TaxID=2626047 RepID=UPI0039C16B18